MAEGEKSDRIKKIKSYRCMPAKTPERVKKNPAHSTDLLKNSVLYTSVEQTPLAAHN